MKVLLSSIAKNDIRLLIRVFNAEKEGKGNDFLERLEESVGAIVRTYRDTVNHKEISVSVMPDFPVDVHYIFEDDAHLLIAAVFKK